MWLVAGASDYMCTRVYKIAGLPIIFGIDSRNVTLQCVLKKISSIIECNVLRILAVIGIIPCVPTTELYIQFNIRVF